MLTHLIRTVLIYLILIIVMRLLGKRQLGELELSELVLTIILSELAVAPILDENTPLLHVLVPIGALVALEFIFTLAETKIPLFKKLLSDEPSLLIDRGKIDQKEMARVRITVEELLSELRLKDIADISDVYYAILEKNGQLSVFPRTTDGLPEKGIMHPIVIDSVLLKKNIAHCSKDEAWVNEQLEARKCTIKDTFLLAADDGGKIYFCKKEK